jgi:hypothetical protein
MRKFERESAIMLFSFSLERDTEQENVPIKKGDNRTMMIIVIR